MQAMPIGVFAVSFKDALSEESRGISVLAHYVKEDAGRAGMLYVNEYNQETIVKRSDASIMSDDAQLELIYYYSSYEMAILRIPLMETIGKQTMISSCNTILKTINLFIFIMTEPL